MSCRARQPSLTACQDTRELRLASQAKIVRRSFSEGGRLNQRPAILGVIVAAATKDRVLPARDHT